MNLTSLTNQMSRIPDISLGWEINGILAIIKGRIIALNLNEVRFMRPKILIGPTERLLKDWPRSFMARTF